MSANRTTSHHRSRLFVVGVVLTSGIVFSLVAYYLSADYAQQLLLANLDREADLRVRAVEQRLAQATNTKLAPLVRFRRLGPEHRAMFRDLAELRLSANEDIVALMWAQRIWREEISNHEQQVRNEGLAEYRVHSQSDEAFEPADILLPVIYAEPESTNQTTFGLDLTTIPEVRDALQRSAQNRGPAVTRPMNWTDDSGSSLVVMMLRAMIRNRTPDDSTDLHQEKLLGFAVVVIGVGEIIENALASFEPGMDVVLSGDFNTGSLQPVCRYDSMGKRTVAIEPGAAATDAASMKLASLPVTLQGGEWTVHATPTLRFVAKRRSILPRLTLAAGLLLTVVVSAYLNTALSRNATIHQLVVRRTAELEKANDELSRERFLLTTLLDQSPDYIYFKDKESRFIRVSRAHAEHFGLADTSAAEGKTDFDVFPDNLAKQFRADEMQVMETGAPVIDKEEHQDNALGKHVWLSTSKVSLRNEDGEIVGTFGISRDISARKRVEEELAAAKAAAEAANQAKSDFVANMSHEIRTPMNAVIGLTELVLDSELSETQREYLKMVLESGESLLAIINDILDFSKIEAGKLDLEPAPFDLRELLGDTMKSLAFRAHAKGLELACRVAPDVPDRLVGDAGRLRQVIVNLVGNAVKFTDAGEVVLELDGEHGSQSQVDLHVTIRDTGVGINRVDQPHIFNAFEQVDASSTRRFGGSGLGLAICNRLVHLMDGHIWVESVPQEGSIFHFTVRFDFDADEQQETTPDTVSGTRVLVADDSQTSRRILAETLSSWEMVPSCAASSEQAFDLACEAQRRGQPFPLIIIDATMPEVDGFDLAEKIQQNDSLSCAVVMMLTSGGRPQDISRCEQLDISAYLLKPAKQSELFDAIVFALGIRNVEDEFASRQSGESPVQLPPMRILLAEDSLVNQKLAVGLLEKHGHTVLVAGDGREAVAAFDSHQFDLVLMDVQMPEMDGFEATAIIRAKQKDSQRHTPIVAMTAHAMKGDRRRCLKAGMDGYVAKPIRAARLFEAIENAIKGTPVDLADVEEHGVESNEVDWEEAMASVGGDRELLRQVVEGFLEECPQILAALRQAVADTDAQQVAAAAHKLKGTVRYFGPTEAFKTAWHLEETARNGNLSDANTDAAALEQAVTQLINSVIATCKQEVG